MKRKVLLAGAAAFVALFLFSGCMLYREYSDAKHSEETFDRVSSLIVSDPVNTDALPPDSEAAQDDEEEPHTLSAREKYAEVFERNYDFIGWISIEGTNIDYPVMQSVDHPNFYLKHNFEKDYSDYGVPYVQENCDVEGSDNLLIYGHHMNDGSMFADLCKYESEDFYNNHRMIRFDTLYGYGEYEIVTVFKTVAYSDNGYKYNLFVDAQSKEDFDSYIASCKALSLYDTGVDAQYGDRLITLSTCEYSRKNGRMVIVAKKVDSLADEEAHAA